MSKRSRLGNVGGVVLVVTFASGAIDADLCHSTDVGTF